ncbi:TetR/AcrR family transcriptional regulator [Qipengyuania flava]|uniref:TetR/AcrR family transcriptional regulator n=1 Tax=Qipengyuania flava TaxID=192812 RepID=UPI001CD715C8|nr:TetR/AcrR family transcriptional regulator [Qipengyuania flava]MCA0891795.1 TetR/AcrR family transcriptional regulator [Qipengyuania flava]
MAASASQDRNMNVRARILGDAQRLIAARGFTGVGLSEILRSAGIPKGSFYYWFASKEAFGADLLRFYFENYLRELDEMLSDQDATARERLSNYWRFWRDNQESNDLEGKCLAVKLAAEVSDISEDMRNVLSAGTTAIIGRITNVLEEGFEDGSILTSVDAKELAETLYQIWLGASLMTKITRNAAPFDAALKATDQMLQS